MLLMVNNGRAVAVIGICGAAVAGRWWQVVLIGAIDEVVAAVHQVGVHGVLPVCLSDQLD